MAKRAGKRAKRAKAKTGKRGKVRGKVRARAKAGGKKPAPRKGRRKAPPAKAGSAFQIMIDTINETERLREKREPRGSDETQ